MRAALHSQEAGSMSVAVAGTDPPPGMSLLDQAMITLLIPRHTD